MLERFRTRIKAAIKTAVGLESHNNRYYFDVNTSEYRNLIGGFIDGDYFYPIRFGIKLSQNRKSSSASTHIVLISNPIEKDKVIDGRSTHPIDMSMGTPNLSEIKIAHLLEVVNE